MATGNVSEHIHKAVTTWVGVTAHSHRFDGTEYRLGKREIGHIHGDYLVDIPFPKKIRDELVEAKRAEPHHVLPQSGWVSFYIRKATDIEEAISLLRRSYELAVEQKSRKVKQRDEHEQQLDLT
jgi:hypothetical protein